jgi:beta-galactosidase/beta-glucuronidase
MMAAMLAVILSTAVVGDVPRQEYPRPQFVRSEWRNLNGTWTCELETDGAEPRDWRETKGLSRPISVPFCAESRLSGIGHTGFIPRMWYHRSLEIPADWNDRILLHFGGVDYHTACSIDGRLVGRHAGGQGAFTFDIAPFVTPGGRHDLVLEVRDDVRAGLQPAGKQSHALKSGGCHYTRVTGIWQTVWMEPVSRRGLRDVSIVPDLDRSRFAVTPAFWSVAADHTVRVTLLDAGKEVSAVSAPQATGVPLTLDVPAPKPWSPETPHLYDLRLELLDPSGEVIDRVDSYAGLRKVHLENGRFYLNNRPRFLRLVLDQGYDPDGIWTAPNDAALRQGIELAQAAGFNGARLHQKVFEPRFHYWADRLGYLTWGEAASWGCNAAKPEARDNFLREWREIVARDRNHPSIIAWTPWNEVWATEGEAQVARTLRDTCGLTRALDPTRPVHTSSGGAHVETDIWSVHCYEQTPVALAAVLAAGEDATLAKVQQAHTEATTMAGLPFFVGEFGGITWNAAGDAGPPESWGYGDAPKDKESFLRRLDALVDTVLAVPDCAGYCYTQLTDVEQEVNGIYTYDRREKFDMRRIRAAFTREPSAPPRAAVTPPEGEASAARRP